MKLSVQQIMDVDKDITIIGKALNEWMKDKAASETNSTVQAYRSLQSLMRDLKTVEVKVA